MSKSFLQLRQDAKGLNPSLSIELKEILYGTTRLPALGKTNVYENPDLKELRFIAKDDPQVAIVLRFNDVYVFSRDALHDHFIKSQGFETKQCIKLIGRINRTTGFIYNLEFSMSVSADDIENYNLYERIRRNKNFNKVCKVEYEIPDLSESLTEDVEFICEAAAKKKIVVRNNKRKVIWKCPPGYKKRSSGGKTCVKRTGSESYKLKRKNKKAARKRRSKRAIMIRKRKRSNIKRKNMGLKNKGRKK